MVCLMIAFDAGSARGADDALSRPVQVAYKRLLENEAVKKGLDFIQADHENTIFEQKQICSPATRVCRWICVLIASRNWRSWKK